MPKDFYEMEFSLKRKHLLELSKVLLKNKKSNTNKYWSKRQDLMRINIEKKRNLVKISNESNLGNLLKKENYVFVKTFFFAICNKFLYNILKKKNDNVYLRIQNLKLNLIFLKNKKKIKSIKNPKIKDVLTKINQIYPLKIQTFFELFEKIEKVKNKFQLNKCIEIGSGPAIHVGLLNYLYGSKAVIVDLAIQKNIAFIFLKKYFPDIKSDFNGYQKIIKKYQSIEKAFKYNDIIYIEPEYIDKLPSNYFNFSINVTSMQEMSKKQIKIYMKILQNILIPNNFLLLINRKKKYLGNNKFFKFDDILCVNYTKLLSDTYSYPKFNYDSSHIVSIIKINKEFKDYFLTR